MHLLRHYHSSRFLALPALSSRSATSSAYSNFSFFSFETKHQRAPNWISRSPHVSYHSTTHAGKSQSLQMDEKTDSEHQQQQQGHQAYINSMCDSEASDSFGDDQAKRDEYTALLKKLFAVNRSHVVKYGVDNTQDLCNVLPPAYSGKTFPIIHVAGTNGKGSVCLKIARTLEQLGLKVGLFASPHISSFRERMSINGDYISETQVQEYLEPLMEAAEKHDLPASFFEYATLLALGYYDREKVDVAVIEVGLGGRLDSTNVVSPILSVITNIGLDHTRILGDTIDKIAYEKAGIIKQDIPVVVGPHVPRHVVDPIAKDCNSTVVEAYPDQPTPPSVSAASMPAPPVSHSSSASSLSAADTDYDVENSKIVRTAIEYLYNNDILLSPSRHEKAALQDALDVGIAQRPACRFQLKTVHVPVPVPVSVPGESKGIGETSTAVDAIQASTEPLNVDSVPVPVVLDVAHNADALTALMKMLVRRRDQIDQTRTSRTTSTPNGPPKIRLVMGLCQEKSMNDCFEALIKEHTTISSESIGDGQTNTGVSISGIHLVQANTARAATLDALKEAVKTAAQNQCSSNVACRRDTGDSSADHVIDEQYFFPVEAGVNGGNVTATIRAALSESARVNANVSHGEEREIVVVCGSVFLMTESRQALGIPQPLDPM